MALVPRTGSQDTQSSREQPRNLRPEIDDKAVVLDGQAILDETAVSNTFINNTAFNSDSFANSKSLIAGFPEGRILVGTYFSQNSPITDIQSNLTNIVTDATDDVHVSWTQIRNFELRCNSDLSYEYTEGNNVSNMGTEALIFPGFTPRVSDVFVYGLRNGKIGLFYVTATRRLALGQDTYHAVNLVLKRWMTGPERDRFSRQSTVVCYFDKVKFVAGNTAMLSSEGFIQQKELSHIRREIIQNYVDRFYRSDMSSFIRPDGIYDPYIVEYWLKKVSILTAPIKPLQLMISIKNFKKTIWAALTNNPIKNLSNLATECSTQTSVATFWGINVTSLLGNKFLTVGDEEGAKVSGYLNPDGATLVSHKPFHSYNGRTFRELCQTRTKEQFKENRHFFYSGFLTDRKCAPHQHPVDIPFKCDPHKCVECDEHDGVHFPFKLHRPPFPILSTESLWVIWKRLKNINDQAIVTDTQMAEFRGYVQWYRTTYSGTLSRLELEEIWRKESGILPDTELDENQEAGLLEYISSYRKQFLSVLTNREIEVIWRVKERIELSVTLTDEQLIQVSLVIKSYRDNHGYPPEDGILILFPVIGSPITNDEVSTAGGVTYDKFVMLESPTFSDLVAAIEGNLPLPEKPAPIPPDYVPTIFQPQHPTPQHHLHCHDVCHELCGGGNTLPGDKPPPPIEYPPSYALSREFYFGSETMDPFEKLVYESLTAKNIDPAKTLDAVTRYLEWTDEDAFYRHLLSLYLIDKSLYWLTFHS